MSEEGISHTRILALGLVGGLIGIYATPYNPILGPLLASLGAVCAIIWGADAIRSLASYGLGTGVPSIGYMSLAIGIVGVVAGLATGIIIGKPILGPIIGLILAMILGGVVAILGKKVVGMKIPILISGTVQLAGASALSVLGFSAAIAGNLHNGCNISQCYINRFHRTSVYNKHNGDSAPIQRMFRSK